VVRYSSHLNRFRSDVKDGSLSIWSRIEGKNFASLLWYERGALLPVPVPLPVLWGAAARMANAR
jgi:hypothetical protein